MKPEEAVQNLERDLPGSFEKKHCFHDQTTLDIKKENLKNVLVFLRDQGFDVLMDLTAADYLQPVPHSRVIYFLHSSADNERLRIVLTVGRGEEVPTVTDLWIGAFWHEREVFDLFGIKFEGHHRLRRLLMPDDWKGHPLQKDYALTEEVVEFKHGVRPKVPSEIIPHVKKPL